MGSFGLGPQNLLQLLEQTARAHPENGLLFYSPGDLKSEPQRINYPEFLIRAKLKAQQLYQLELEPGSMVLLHFSKHQDNLEWFWAVTYGGFIPIMSTPFSNKHEIRKAHIEHLHSLFNDPLCLTSKDLLPDFASQNLLKISIVEEIGKANTEKGDHVFRNKIYFPVRQGAFKESNDIAALMLTSGSTGKAKAVCLTHSMILESVANKRDVLGTRSDMPFFNWIGADHVACLTEMHIHAILVGAEQIYAQAADIVMAPLSFLEIISENRVAHSFAPNFFLAKLYQALEKRQCSEAQLSSFALDLHCLKSIVTGGEANVVDTCVSLKDFICAFGASNNCLKPAWGMTETCGGSIYSDVFPAHDIEHGHQFASVGKSVSGMQLRITDESGNTAKSGIRGSLEVKGPMVCSTYLNDLEATNNSFHGEWFITGDQGVIDAAGQLNLTGRAKEAIIINGVNHTPHSIERALEKIPGTVLSYTLAFAYRTQNSETEKVCIVYLPEYQTDDTETRISTNDSISNAVMLHVGTRPLVIPLDEKYLQKSTLGKLSRSKISKAFQNGDLACYRQKNDEETFKYREMHYQKPSTETEAFLLNILLETVEVEDMLIGVKTNFFALGLSSIDLIKIQRRIQAKTGRDVPIITILNNPTIQGLEAALKRLQSDNKNYDSMVILQSQGSRTPLWLIHPGVGEILVFLPLAGCLTDRPVYAMRAKGFQGEGYFSGIDEAIVTYHKKIKQIQPEGPYAIAGYSFGSMLAFEITKKLNSEGDTVSFLGIFNLPPHIKLRMRQLDWTNCLLHLSYFLGFFSEEYAHLMHPILQQQPREETLHHVLGIAPKERMDELGLDAAKLANWVDLAYSLQSSAVNYEPSGSVESMDVFCAIPLAAVARDMDDWVKNKLGKWNDFVKTTPKYHRVDGAHYTMIDPEHVHSFQKVLRDALEQRGI